MAFKPFEFISSKDVDDNQEELERLESEKAYLESQTSTLEQKLASKEIKKKEYEALLNELYIGKTKEEVRSLLDEKINKLRQRQASHEAGRRKKVLLTAGSAIAMILLVSVIALFSSNSDITGFSVSEIPTDNTYVIDRTFTSNGEIVLEASRVLGLRISGTVEGGGAVVKLVSGEQNYVVGNLSSGSSITYSLSADKYEYNLGDNVELSISPQDADASLYVSHNGEETLLETNSFTPPQIGEYNFFAIITTDSDIYRLEVNATVVSEDATEEAGQTASVTESSSGEFNSVCEDTCLLQEEIENASLVVSLEEGATLTITSIDVVETQTNEAPEQISQFNDVEIQAGQSITLQLNDYFEDPNEEELSYDFSQAEGFEISISGDSLEITGTTPGTYTGHAYATDGLNMVSGNDFNITVSGEAIPAQEEENETNETTQPVEEVEVPQNNVTEENMTIGNVTESEPPQTLTNCNDPNPNMRPLSCIEGSEEDYFTARAIYLENGNKLQVARVTTFGNLIITGELFEKTTSSPRREDFRISYLASDLETEITTAWIDSETGDLHLVGDIYEEQISLVPPTPDAYQVQNQKGTTLAYFDRRSGDLYLRGNVIVEKPEIAPEPQVTQE